LFVKDAVDRMHHATVLTPASWCGRESIFVSRNLPRWRHTNSKKQAASTVSDACPGISEPGTPGRDEILFLVRDPVRDFVRTLHARQSRSPTKDWHGRLQWRDI